MFYSLLKPLVRVWGYSEILPGPLCVTEDYCMRLVYSSQGFLLVLAELMLLSITFKMSGLFPFPWGVHRSLWHAKRPWLNCHAYLIRPSHALSLFGIKNACNVKAYCVSWLVLAVFTTSCAAAHVVETFPVELETHLQARKLLWSKVSGSHPRGRDPPPQEFPKTNVNGHKMIKIMRKETKTSFCCLFS